MLHDIGSQFTVFFPRRMEMYFRLATWPLAGATHEESNFSFYCF